jgi:hypothetical protein
MKLMENSSMEKALNSLLSHLGQEGSLNGILTPLFKCRKKNQEFEIYPDNAGLKKAISRLAQQEPLSTIELCSRSTQQGANNA